jgi:thiamine pyrophosphokinase
MIALHGDRSDIAELPRWAAGANSVLAADGGAAYLIEAGIVPDVVIGDMDGLRENVRSAIPADRIHLQRGQDTTDCQKALAFAESNLAADNIVVWGAEGSRLDHTLSALASSIAIKASVRYAFSTSIAHIVRGGDEWNCAVPLNCLISLIPLLPSQIGSATGLRWPVEGLSLSPGIRDGISNLSTQTQVSVLVDDGCVAAFVSRFEGDIVW